MKKIIIVIFVITISKIFYSNYISLSEENNIDFLDKALQEVKDITLNTHEVFYFSNNKSVALYYKTQFSLAPKVVIKRDFMDIPKGSYIVGVVDPKPKKKKLLSKNKLIIKDTIINVIDNEYYQVMLLKK